MQFGMVVSAYAWSAGISGLVMAGFADRYDRRKLLLFFYSGFVIGTVLCEMADSYRSLLVARIFTGLFAGVIGSLIYAIVADVFTHEVRGRVMGFLQMAFAGASVLGLPSGLYFANRLGWQSPFLILGVMGIALTLVMALLVKPVDVHLQIKSEGSPFQHLKRTILNPDYVRAFATTVLVATAGFMMMPFASAFTVGNNGIALNDLPIMYMSAGIAAMATAPLLGKLSDSVGKYTVFCICSALMMISVPIYCNLDIISLGLAIFFSVVMFTTYAGRMISSSALFAAIPDPADRGAFMTINSSVNMVSGAIASTIAGSIVYQTANGRIENYDILGYVVTGTVLVTVVMMYGIDRVVSKKVMMKVKVPG